jgi:glycosyltransferase involved in cell wall biosynthesis
MAAVEISCVVPAYENLDLFARCLTSVTAQDDVAFEVIVSDDSASGVVRDFVATLGARPAELRYGAGPRSGNPVANWNHGLAQARGEFCVVVHHDEFLVDRRYLRRAVDALRASGAAAVAGQTAVIGVRRRSRFALVSRLARAIGGPAWLLPAANWIGPTAAFVFRRGPLFDESLTALVDVEFYRRVMAGGPLAFLAGTSVGSLGHHGAQITASLDFKAVVARELRELASRSPPAVGPAELAISQAWLRLSGAGRPGA